ncbi:MAG: TolC family protein [Tepidanaerobacteraceae bacterium]|nr:TolC family protein [Thermoanaerobacterales bacterium]
MGKIWRGKSFLVTVIILVLITSSFVFAQENSKSEDDVLELSLKEALEIAEENNQQVKISELGLEKAKLAKKQYRYQDKKAKDMEDAIKEAIEQWNQLPEEMQRELEEEGLKPVDPGLSSSFEYTYQMDILEKTTDIGVKLAEAGIDVTVKGIHFGVEAAYYGALSAKENTMIAEAALERQKDMLKIAQAQYNVGTVAKKDVLDAEVQLASAEANLLKAQVQEEKAYINLKRLLGLPLDKPIKLTDYFEYNPKDLEKNLEEIIEEAQQSRIDIMSAEGTFEIAKLDFDLNSKVYPSNTFIYKEKEHAMEEARMKLADTRSSVEAEVRGIWLDLKEAETNIFVLDKSLEMAEESLRIAKLSYEAGLIRSVDVAAAEEGFKQVQLQRSAVIYNYNLARLKLENVVYFSVSGSLTV